MPSDSQSGRRGRRGKKKRREEVILCVRLCRQHEEFESNQLQQGSPRKGVITSLSLFSAMFVKLGLEAIDQYINDTIESYSQGEETKADQKKRTETDPCVRVCKQINVHRHTSGLSHMIYVLEDKVKAHAKKLDLAIVVHSPNEFFVLLCAGFKEWPRIACSPSPQHHTHYQQQRQQQRHQQRPQ